MYPFTTNMMNAKWEYMCFSTSHDICITLSYANWMKDYFQNGPWLRFYNIRGERQIAMLRMTHQRYIYWCPTLTRISSPCMQKCNSVLAINGSKETMCIHEVSTKCPFITKNLSYYTTYRMMHLLTEYSIHLCSCVNCPAKMKFKDKTLLREKK